MIGQSLAHQVKIGGVGDEHHHAVFIGGFKVLSTCFDGDQFGIWSSLCRFCFNHAFVLKVPGYRTLLLPIILWDEPNALSITRAKVAAACTAAKFTIRLRQ